MERAFELKRLIYLMFVNFGAPPHYFGLQKYINKCVNLRQNSKKIAKMGKYRPKFCALSAKKYTVLEKVHYRQYWR